MTPHLLDDWITQSMESHYRYYFVIMFAFSSILFFLPMYSLAHHHAWQMVSFY